MRYLQQDTKINCRSRTEE
jgi:hypothetical protein